MNNENTSITTLTGQGGLLLSRYSLSPLPERERTMKHTINEAKKAVNYFINQGMIEEMTTDKRYYTQSLIDYIIKLENELIELDKKAK